MKRTLLALALALLFAFALPATVLAQDVVLSVPPLSQVGNYATAWGDCGSCVAAMIGNYYHGGGYTCDSVHSSMGLSQFDTPPHIGIVAQLASEQGIPVRLAWGVNIDRVRSELYAGHPVMVALPRGGAAHGILVIGVTADGSSYRIIDPADHDPAHHDNWVGRDAIESFLRADFGTGVNGWVWLTG